MQAADDEGEAACAVVAVRISIQAKITEVDSGVLRCMKILSV
jgi:hypothetical protein